MRMNISFSPDERRQMGLNARRLVENKYSAAAMAANMLSMYQEIVGSK